MRAFKIKSFNNFARRENISEGRLFAALEEILAGNPDASLGGGLYKQRVAREGGGKSGGYRVILCLHKEDRAFFLMGFAKSGRANLTRGELEAFRELAKYLLNLEEDVISSMLADGSLIEMEKADESL